MYNGTMASIEEGEIVKSTCSGIRDNLVVLDIGFKSEGTVPLEEFKDLPELKAGDEVEVLLEHLEDQEGSVVLSKKKADFMRVWERIRVAYETDQPVEGTLVKKIKGGVVVDLMGVDAFLPGSQIALRRVPNIDELLGQKYEFKIIKLNKRRRNIVVSRRVILETERAGKREKLMKELEEGPGAKGRRQEHHRLRRVHRPGWRRRPAAHHRHVVGPHLRTRARWSRSAQELEVKVLDIDWERERISPGHQAAAVLPVEERGGEVSGRHTGPGQGRVDHQLRRVRRARAGDRRTRAHQRDELDAQCAPSVQDRLALARRSTPWCSRSTPTKRRSRSA